MNIDEQNYLNLLKHILDNGEDRQDRTGVGTKAVFGKTLRFDLSNNTLPILTTRRIFFRGIVEELLFFIRGETDTKKLEEKGINIWKGNTSREFLDKRGLSYLPEGSYGKAYGYQWRRFNGNSPGDVNFSPKNTIGGTDQITQVLQNLKNNPQDRRHLVVAWNPSQLHEMALPPCHYSMQFYVSNNNELFCLFNMRSVDSFLGLPFNIASYALLTHIFAKHLGYKAKEVIWVGGDTHIYSNHINQIKEQIQRTPYEFPKIKIKKDITSIDDIENLSFEDFELVGYNHHPAIKAEMAI
jgi:thymidylate synthase